MIEGIAILVVCQYGSCAAPVRYQQSYSAQQYVAPQPYAYIDALAYSVYQPLYSTVVGMPARGQARLNETLAVDQDLARQVGSLAIELGKLRTSVAALGSGPAPLPERETYVPRTPPLPSKSPLPSPQSPIAPLEGSVPPPPFPSPQSPGKGSPDDPVPPNPNPSVPSLPSAGSGTQTDLARAVTVVFANKCIKCHAGASTAGKGFKILEDGGALAGLGPLDKLKIDLKTYAGEMPPDPRNALTREEYATVRAYINEDKDAIEIAIKGLQGRN